MMKIVITGSSSGIGHALASRLLKNGHSVWGLARSTQLPRTTEALSAFHSSKCDVADWPSVTRVAGEIAAKWGSVDAVVCCAGSQGEVGPALDADPLRWSATVRANLEGTYYSVRAFWPLLSGTAGRAKIVCFSGGGATKARSNFSAYGVAKTAIVRLVETIAEEDRTKRLDINAIAPGAINTRLTDEVIALGPGRVGESEYAAAVEQKSSGGGSIEQALDLVDWLLSHQSDGISGKLISAPWDPWKNLNGQSPVLSNRDMFTLRRVTPETRA